MTNDFYETPIQSIKSLALEIKATLPDIERILDCGAGTGVIGSVLGLYIPHSTIGGIEIDVSIKRPPHYAYWQQCNFLEFESSNKALWQLYISNPPFSHWRRFVTHMLELANERNVYAKPVVVLGRLGLLESQKRYTWWKSLPTPKLRVLSKRPSFTKGGTDNSAYAWYLFNFPAASKTLDWYP